MQLQTAEALGGVTVICAGKNGTLTGDAMMVTDVRTATRAYGVTGRGYEPTGSFVLGGRIVRPVDEPDLLFALRTAALANRSDVVAAEGGWRPVGNRLEAALIVAARKAGIERADILGRAPETGTVPFTYSRRLMATFHRQPIDGSILACVKGAPDRVLALCQRVRVDGAEAPLDESFRSAILAANHLLAIRGLRVIVVASGPVVSADELALTGLTFDGLIGIDDPPAIGASEAIESFRRAGVRTVMLTGDQPDTALAAAGELGIDYSPAKVLDGAEVDRLPDEVLQARLADVNVFSRVGPQARLRIVAGFKARGEVVAVVGDDVEEVAVSKADAEVMTPVPGPGLQALEVAIQEGRTVLDNVRKFIFYLVSCGLAGTLLLFGAAAAGWPIRLLIVQGLWLSLVTAVFPALALAAEPSQADVMQRPPADLRSALLSARFLQAIAFYALLMAGATLLVVGWCQYAGVPAGRAITMNFLVLGLAQLLHLGNARDSRPVLRPSRVVANRLALTAVGLALVLQVLAVRVQPLRELLRLEPLTGVEWLLVVVAGAIPAVAGQAIKAMRDSR
jgi:Ca2+-transporting ATPase